MVMVANRSTGISSAFLGTLIPRLTRGAFTLCINLIIDLRHLPLSSASANRFHSKIIFLTTYRIIT